MGLFGSLRKKLERKLLSKLREKVAHEVLEREGPKVAARLQRERGPLSDKELELIWACMEYYTEELLR